MDLKKLEVIKKAQANPVSTILRSESSVANEDYLYYKTPVVLNIDVPDEFNGKEIWSEFLSPVLDQGKCGSCWAFATAACLADRFNIHSNGKVKLQLSVASMVLCDWKRDEFTSKQRFSVTQDIQNLTEAKRKGCYGNSLADAWYYLYVVGTPSESCVPYSLKEERMSISEFETTDDIPLCIEMTGMYMDMCRDFKLIHFAGKEMGTPARFYRCFQYYSIPGVEEDGGSAKNLQMHIYKYGPISSGMLLFLDFYDFDPKKDVYKWNGTSPLTGGHAIEIVGWGTDNGVDFWWVRNSWGRTWGNDGYFKIIRGVNECEIESNAMSGMPDFFFPYDLKWKSPEIYNFYWKGWKISKEIEMERLSSDLGINQLSGGLTYTGYTRRVVTLMPFINFTPPLDYKTDLPDYEGAWMAGHVIGKRVARGLSALGPRRARSAGSVISLGIMTILLIVFIFLCFKIYNVVLHQ